MPAILFHPDFTVGTRVALVQREKDDVFSRVGFDHRSGFTPCPEEDKINITKLLTPVKQNFPAG